MGCALEPSNSATYVAASTVQVAGNGLFAADSFVAGERLFNATGPFYSLEELQMHPQHDKICEYSIAYRRSDNRNGAISPLDLECCDVAHRWGLMNEPPVLAIDEWPSLRSY